ncbi:MAG: hypothetical protein WCK29_03620, partial [archaeon]
MEIKIPWIGDTIYYKLQAMEIQDEFGITVEEHRSADDGLTALLKQKYPLIIVNDKLTRDGLILPEGLSGEDFCGIACYVIGEVRKNS